LRKITFWLSLILIFVIPWEDSVKIEAVGSVARVMGFVVAGFWLLTVLSEGEFRKFNVFHHAVLAFFVWNLLSTFWSIDADATLIRVGTYGQIFLLILILWELYVKPEDLLSGLQAYVLGGFVSIASTFINFYQGRNISEFEYRYSATGVNAVDMAVLLILGLPLAWHLFVLSRSIYKNPVLAFVNLSYLPLAIYAVILTGSRTSLFAVAPVAIYILLSSQIRPATKILAVTALAACLTVLSFYVPQAVLERLGTVGRSVRSADLGGRGDLWNKTLDVFEERPLLGSGTGTVPAIIGGAAHNTFLSILAETGIVGALLFMTILAIVFVQALKMPTGYVGVWLALLAVYIIGGSSLTWEYRKPTWLIFSFINIQGQVAYEAFHIRKSKNATAGMAAVRKGEAG
jgi:O-antigen ligase